MFYNPVHRFHSWDPNIFQRTNQPRKSDDMTPSAHGPKVVGSSPGPGAHVFCPESTGIGPDSADAEKVGDVVSGRELSESQWGCCRAEKSHLWEWGHSLFSWQTSQFAPRLRTWECPSGRVPVPSPVSTFPSTTERQHFYTRQRCFLPAASWWDETKLLTETGTEELTAAHLDPTPMSQTSWCGWKSRRSRGCTYEHSRSSGQPPPAFGCNRSKEWFIYCQIYVCWWSNI